MIDLIVPIARVVDLVICEDQVPWDLTGEVSGVLRGRAQVEEFAYAYGRAAKPRKPLMIFGPDDYMPIVVIGDGLTEASEMQDLADEALGQQEANVRRFGRGMDFDEARERRGMVRREDFGAAMAEAFAERVRYLKANQVTDPLGLEANKARRQF